MLFGRRITSSRGRRLDRGEELRRGRVHRLAALDHDRRAEAAEEPLVSRARAYGDDCGPRAPVLARGGQARLALGRLRVHVLDVDLVDDARGGAERERPAGIVGVDVDLHGARRADHEERVAEVLELALEPRGVDVLALDEEARAVAVAGELLVQRLDRERRLEDRRGRQRLAAHVRRDPADELEQAGSACVDDAGRSKRLELVARRASATSPCATTSARAAGSGRSASSDSARSASSRATVRIVPSCGSRTAA